MFNILNSINKGIKFVFIIIYINEGGGITQSITNTRLYIIITIILERRHKGI